MHYGLDWTGFLPKGATNSIMEQEHFQWDYTTFMNIGFLIISGILLWLGKKGNHSGHHHEMASKGKVFEKVLTTVAYTSYVWLAIGLVLKYIIL